ncbi:galanin peptides-like [Hypanus sabinus]|uniref:galanin peptides-like n=1 Tax=Hypanus sabinus TaxID=79690 RepID=UPI0028C50EF4|nr:galanin peptides-like [Hypanus sabinus]
MKMPSSASFLCASLVLCVAVSHSLGLVLSAKERRGWTLNSAGYLLGPQAMRNYPRLNKKLNPIGKRDLQFEDNVKPGSLLQTVTDETAAHLAIEFLMYLHLKEMGVLDELLSLSSPELGQS